MCKVYIFCTQVKNVKNYLATGKTVHKMLLIYCGIYYRSISLILTLFYSKTCMNHELACCRILKRH